MSGEEGLPKSWLFLALERLDDFIRCSQLAALKGLFHVVISVILLPGHVEHS